MLIIGGIDLSVGSVLCLSMTICSLLFLGGMNPWLAALVAVAACVLIGLIMGMIVTRLGLSYFIVTLAFMGIARGLVLILSGGTPVSIVAELDAQTLFKSLGQGQFLGIIPMQVVIFLVIALVSDYIVRSSSAMRLVFYTGSNEKAAEYSGINTNKVKILVGMVCSGLCGVAGIIYLTKFSGVPMSAGSGLEMTAISSAVIGGASLTGGRGTVAGSILGLALMAFVTNAMTLFTVPPFWQDFIKYSILLIAVVLDQLQQKAKLRRT
jgi:ribose transport system permease protein